MSYSAPSWQDVRDVALLGFVRPMGSVVSEWNSILRLSSEYAEVAMRCSWVSNSVQKVCEYMYVCTMRHQHPTL